ncbi:hypothetical protein F4808DRAFT_284725 [Astrocystis sublimbata]|nr:hypothetical protein F4808DRAFT_284725 [Astrocystis sublimbata]
MAAPPSDEQLLEGAELGKLPFDTFVLSKWDYTRPVERDQEQWDGIAREWLNLDPRGRHPYHGYDDEPANAEVDATADQMNRVLVPHQTTRERNLSLRTEMGRYAPVWLRSCYDQELSSAYVEWLGGMELEHVLGHWSQILDDESRYARFADDWTRLLLSAPAIADTVRYVYETDASLQDPAEDYEPPEDDERRLPLYEAMVRERTMLFLVDEDALRTGFIKVLWLNDHGACVWDNRLRPDQMLAFKGHLFDGGSLATLSEEWEDDETMWKRGAVIEVD